MKFLLNMNPYAMKFLMNMPRSLAKRLQDKGYLFRHAEDIGLSYAEDWEIIEEARRQGEIILTHNLDYGGLLAFTRQSSPSIIIFRIRRSQPDQIFQKLIDILPFDEPRRRMQANR
jgi:predicted nuclease of predicted toxin-antitoxin system